MSKKLPRRTPKQRREDVKRSAGEAPRLTASEVIARQIEAEEALKARRVAAKEAGYREQIKQLSEQLDAEKTRSDFVQDVRALCGDIRIETGRKGRVLSKDRRIATALAVISDLHIEERVDAAKVNGINRYTPEIAEFRVRRIFEGVEWLTREQQGMFDIQDLFLNLNGDIITGYIHEELLEANYMSPTQAVVFGVRILGDGIRFLLKNTKLKIHCVCKCGNHGRTTFKLRIGTAVANSFEWLLYHMLASEFANEPRVSWQIDEGHHSISEVYGLRIHTHHGDSVRSNGGIGGVDVPLNRAVLQWHAKLDAHMSIVGHFHQYQHGARLIRNGSGIGYGAYSDWLPSAAPEQPLQAFGLIDSKRGFCQATGIWCGDTSAEARL